MAAKLWPQSVKLRVQQKLSGIDAEAELIRNNSKEFYKYVEKVAIENERVFVTLQEY
jgi:hypothetical protein